LSGAGRDRLASLPGFPLPCRLGRMQTCLNVAQLLVNLSAQLAEDFFLVRP